MRNFLVISTLSLGLLSGTALAQVSVDSSTSGGVSASVGDTSVGVNAGADAGTTAGTSNAGAASGSVDASVGGTSIDAQGTAAASVSTGTNTGNTSSGGNTSSSTASAQSDAGVSAALSGLNDGGDRFFGGNDRTTLADDGNFTSAFVNLSPAQQSDLRTACQGMSGSSFAEFCKRISGM